MESPTVSATPDLQGLHFLGSTRGMSAVSRKTLERFSLPVSVCLGCDWRGQPAESETYFPLASSQLTAGFVKTSHGLAQPVLVTPLPERRRTVTATLRRSALEAMSSSATAPAGPAETPQSYLSVVIAMRTD
jgi:hypothetical protein